MGKRVLLTLVCLSGCFFCLAQSPVWAQDLLVMDSPTSAHHTLRFSSAIDAAQLEARATLLPEQQQVSVANRLILVSGKPLDLTQFGSDVREQIQSLELLVHYPNRYLYLAHCRSLQQTLTLASNLASSPLLLYLQPDLLPLRKPLLRPQGWNHPLTFDEASFRIADYLPLDALWKKSKGAGIKVAVIDSGIDLSHPALRRIPMQFSWDIDANIPGAQPEDNDLHGTWVAGIIWSRPEFAQGVTPFTTGVAWGIAPESALIALKLRRPWTSNLIRTFALAEQHKADVINVSWLLPWVTEPMREYLRYLTSDANEHKGIAIIAAADPQYQPNIGLAAIPELLVVSSTDHKGVLAESSWDANVDFAAVSYVQSVSFRLPALYERFAKTSASAPVVSGLVALLRAIKPDLTAKDLHLLLVNSATQAEVKLPDGQLIRYKILDANKAYAQLIDERLQQ